MARRVPPLELGTDGANSRQTEARSAGSCSTPLTGRRSETLQTTYEPTGECAVRLALRGDVLVGEGRVPAAICALQERH
jgi:hypothetical protein